ncbi:MAG: hypothetical protein AB7N65_20495, partial [Vicinamibacterales bacterium]
RTVKVERQAGIVRRAPAVHVIVRRDEPDGMAGPPRPDVRKVEDPQRLTRGQADALAQAADYCGAFKGGSV